MDRVALMGALSLVRMKPVLEFASAPFIDEIDEIVSVGGTTRSSVPASVVEALRRAWSGFGIVEDATSPEYFQVTALDVAIAVAEESPSPSRREEVISASAANFWACCDQVLHAADGYERPEFMGVKNTLEGVEDLWIIQDARLLHDARGAPQEIFSNRLRRILDSYPKRRSIARIVAECAGWDIPAARV